MAKHRVNEAHDLLVPRRPSARATESNAHHVRKKAQKGGEEVLFNPQKHK